MMCPMQVERKHLTAINSSSAQAIVDTRLLKLTPSQPEQFHMNLACASTLSEGTIEAKKDRYEGLCRAESEDGYNFASRKSIETSDVFIPRQTVEILNHGLHALSNADVNTVGSQTSYDDDITLDSIIDNMYDDTPPTRLDMTHIRAASDDESIVSLTKRDYNFLPFFKNQKQADSIAGHIGLILPFFDKVKTDTELMAKDVMNRVMGLDTPASTFTGIDLGSQQNIDISEASPEETLLESVAKSASNDNDVSALSNVKNDSVVDASAENRNSSADGGGDSPSEDSDESYELSEYESPVVGQVIHIQDLGSTKHGWVRNRRTKSLSENNGVPQSQQIVVVDHRTLHALDQTSSSHKSPGKWSPWGWRKKSNKNKNSIQISDRFNPTYLPQGNVDDDDDGDLLSCSGSCVTTESILSELKVIENTAKLMYQQLCTSDGGMGSTSDYVSALFSPTATELVLEFSPHEEKEEGTGKSKKGGKLRQLFGKCIPKKKLHCGPVCGVAATWNPNKEDA